jgi:hypothetical protein
VPYYPLCGRRKARGGSRDKRYITACAIDDAGTVVAESRRLDATLDALGRWLSALPQPGTGALEGSLYWHWLERQRTTRCSRRRFSSWIATSRTR